MTLVLFLLLALAAISFALGWYFRQIEAGIAESLPLWDQLIANVNLLVSDPATPDEIAEDVSIYADLAGCGCFVGSLVRDLLIRDLARKYREEKDSADHLRALTSSQKRLLGLIMRDVLLFDSLHMPILGRLFRWMIKQSLAETTDEQHRAHLEGLHSIMYTAHHVAQRRLKQHRVPHQALLARAA
jgi:hypothetical protein